MNESHQSPKPTPRKAAERAERERRLAEALRDNLRRRKQQRRARDEAPPADEPSD
jgi:hypothetical protein